MTRRHESGDADGHLRGARSISTVGGETFHDGTPATKPPGGSKRTQDLLSRPFKLTKGHVSSDAIRAREGNIAVEGRRVKAASNPINRRDGGN